MIGDANDIAARIKRALPRWFGYVADLRPVRDAFVAGMAAALADIFALIDFARKQTRVATSTGGWLELSAFDFFGDDFKRLGGEADAHYSRRIRQEVLRKRQTRDAIDSAVFDLTGNHPQIWEGHYAPVCGGYGTAALAFGVAGLYGSLGAPFTVIVTTPRPTGFGIPNRGGYGTNLGGFGVDLGNISYAGESLVVGNGATEADILRAIERVRAAGITVLVHFTDANAGD